MNEFVNTPMWIQTVFGTLSGWWRFEDPERRSVGPTLSERAWRQAFSDSGWATVYPLYDRRPRPIHATFVVSPIVTSSSLITDAPVYVLADDLPLSEENDKQEEIITQITSLISSKRAITRVRKAEELPPNSVTIYLPSLSSSTLFDGPCDDEFTRMKTVAENCAEIYWTIRGGNMDCPLPQNSPIVGFSRVMKNERPALKSCVIDVDPLSSATEVATSIAEALHLPSMRDEDELVVRKGATGGQSVIYIPRLVPKKVSADLQRLEETTYGECDGLRLEVGTAGLLNTLQWRAAPRILPAKGQVEVQVFATGLNFKGSYP